jgi:hypothetical protein
MTTSRNLPYTEKVELDKMVRYFSVFRESQHFLENWKTIDRLEPMNKFGLYSRVTKEGVIDFLGGSKDLYHLFSSTKYSKAVRYWKNAECKVLYRTISMSANLKKRNGLYIFTHAVRKNWGLEHKTFLLPTVSEGYQAVEAVEAATIEEHGLDVVPEPAPTPWDLLTLHFAGLYPDTWQYLTQEQRRELILSKLNN